MTEHGLPPTPGEVLDLELGRLRERLEPDADWERLDARLLPSLKLRADVGLQLRPCTDPGDVRRWIQRMMR
jgi:hypothetical protein